MSSEEQGYLRSYRFKTYRIARTYCSPITTSCIVIVVIVVTIINVGLSVRWSLMLLIVLEAPENVQPYSSALNVETRHVICP